MIRYEDPVATDIERSQRIGRANNAFYHEGAREQLAVGLQIAPSLRVEWTQQAGVLVDCLSVRPSGRVGLPVAQHRGPAAALEIFDNPAGVGQCLGKDRGLEAQRLEQTAEDLGKAVADGALAL